MFRTIALCYLITIANLGSLIGQDQDRQKNGGADIYLYLLTSYHNDESDNEWSNLGGGADIDWYLKKNWKFGLRSNIRYWAGRDELIVPLQIGPGYHFSLGSSTSLDFQLSVGTHLTIGNDYGAFFAHMSGGIKVNFFEIGNIGLTTGINVAQAVVFHPSQFTYFDWIVGIRF